MAYLSVPSKHIQALERWFHAQAKSTDPKHWDAGLLLGLRACGTYRLSELEPHYDALSESSFERLSLEQKYFAAAAFGSCPFANSHKGLKRLGDQVRNNINDQDIGQATLAMMILKVRYPKLIFGQAAVEDDFPL